MPLMRFRVEVGAVERAVDMAHIDAHNEHGPTDDGHRIGLAECRRQQQCDPDNEKRNTNDKDTVDERRMDPRLLGHGL